MTITIEPTPKRNAEDGQKAPRWLRLVRSSTALPKQPVQVRNAADVAALMIPILAVEEVERVIVVVLDSRSNVRGLVEVSRGLMDAAMGHPRETFRVAIIYGAAGIIIVHNHPSGDPQPSGADESLTRSMVKAGDILGIPVYDHVIIAGTEHFSFANAGLME